MVELATCVKCCKRPSSYVYAMTLTDSSSFLQLDSDTVLVEQTRQVLTAMMTGVSARDRVYMTKLNPGFGTFSCINDQTDGRGECSDRPCWEVMPYPVFYSYSSLELICTTCHSKPRCKAQLKVKTGYLIHHSLMI